MSRKYHLSGHLMDIFKQMAVEKPERDGLPAYVNDELFTLTDVHYDHIEGISSEIDVNDDYEARKIIPFSAITSFVWFQKINKDE